MLPSQLVPFHLSRQLYGRKMIIIKRYVIITFETACPRPLMYSVDIFHIRSDCTTWRAEQTTSKSSVPPMENPGIQAGLTMRSTRLPRMVADSLRPMGKRKGSKFTLWMPTILASLQKPILTPTRHVGALECYFNLQAQFLPSCGVGQTGSSFGGICYCSKGGCRSELGSK
jgi:hypothetical protein